MLNLCLAKNCKEVLQCCRVSYQFKYISLQRLGCVGIFRIL